MTAPDEAELRDQFTRAFENAEYPVSSPMELVPALPDGIGTRFESGEFSMSVMQLNSTLPGGDFPYETVDDLVEDIIDALRDEGHL